jgi:predicted GNAT superfamily acetyltransferase
LPTDRLIAEWWLKSKRVEQLLGKGRLPRIETTQRISVPAAIYEWKASLDTRARAQELQETNRQHFLRAFAERLAVLGYERDTQGNGQFLLGRWDEPWSHASQ